VDRYMGMVISGGRWAEDAAPCLGPTVTTNINRVGRLKQGWEQGDRSAPEGRGLHMETLQKLLRYPGGGWIGTPVGPFRRQADADKAVAVDCHASAAKSGRGRP